MLTLALVPIVPSLSEGGADRPLPQGGLWPKEGCVGLLSRVSVAGATALLCPLCSGFLLPFFYYYYYFYLEGLVFEGMIFRAKGRKGLETKPIVHFTGKLLSQNGDKGPWFASVTHR